MNNDEKIWDILKMEYMKLAKIYDIEQILWVSATGDAAYGDLSKGIEITFCYLPSTPELYNSRILRNDTIDIRYLVDMIQSKDQRAVELVLSPYRLINPKYERFLKNAIFNKKEEFFIRETREKIEELKDNIRALIESTKKIHDDQYQQVADLLSKTEVRVLNGIIDDFGDSGEGNIIVSQSTTKYMVSTSVFRTLFYKLKQSGVAEIDSRGVNGTHIKFYDSKKMKSFLKE